ncbi:MAG: tetratricopeptide repeat protein [Betaproteobacteria bacterium]
MSLINQMLQDIDARQSDASGRTPLPNEVRALPLKRKSRTPVLLGVLVLAVLALGFSVIELDLWPREEALAVVPPPVSAVPVVVAPVAPAEAVTAPVQEKVTPSETPVAPVEPTVLPLQNVEGNLRLSDAITPPEEKKLEKKPEVKPLAATVSPAPTPTPVPSAKTVVAENKPAAAQNKIEPHERAVPATPSVPLAVAGKSGKTSTIERTDAAGSSRERADAEYRKAINAVNQGRVFEALEGLRNALRQDGQHSASRQLLVKLLLEAKQPEEAIQVLRDGLLVQPAHTGWAMTLARLQIDRGDLAGAWQTLDHASPAAGNSADFQGFAAHVLQRLGRQKDAAERYQAATRLSPGEGRWWLGLGLAFEAEGRSTESREAFLRAKQCGNLSPELGAMVEQKLR